MAETKEGIALRLIQLSDLHVSGHRDLLAPMVDTINSEDADLVIVTGDVVHSREKKLYKKAADSLNKIRHRVVLVPGDYDSGDLWHEYFGSNRYNSISLNGFDIELMDTSFMGHRYASGWADVLEKEDPEQHEWIMDRLKIDKYHLIFSHHPFWINPTKEGDQYAQNTLRAVFSGHVHDVIRYYFRYSKPKSTFPNGFVSVPIKFHGNSCYISIWVKENGEMINTPRLINVKRTAW